MAKIFSAFSTSPLDSLLSDCWSLNHLSTIESYDPNILIKNEPDLPELFEDLQCSYSISNDILRMTEDNAFGTAGSESDGDFNTNIYDGESKVRNKNLMWSGNTSQLSTSASSSVSDNGALIPLSFVTGGYTNSTQQQQENNKPPPTVVVANNKSRNNNNKANQQQQSFSLHTSIKMEPFDDYEQQLQQHNIPTSKTTTSSLKNTTEQQNLQHIPPGTSLLRKSNIQQQQQHQRKQPQSKLQIPKMHTSDQLLTTTTLNAPVANSNSSSSRNSTSTIGLYGRPDTPHSLDDESALYNNYNDNDCINTTGFRHQVDLRACIMGSNNISLTATDPTPLINHLSQQLQDTSKNQIDLPFIGANNNRSLAEVLDYINDKDITVCDDDDDDDDVVDGGSNNTTSETDKVTNSMSNLRTSGYDSDEESLGGASSISSSLMNEDSLCTKIGGNSPATSPISHTSSSSSNSPQYLYSRSESQQQQKQQQQQTQPQSYLHSDHSYTRCKDGIDDLGNLDHLDTPSDSDEEIDVVSIGDKKLPTNPSDKDRRVLQTKVACKFANPRVVKTVNGLRTIPPRSRGSFELPYTPASSSPVKSVANSRYPSPASTPYHNQYTSTPIIVMNANSEKSRKRINGIIGVNGVNGVNNADANNADYVLPPLKKCRGKKQQPIQNNNLLKRHYSSDETTDTIEKRNLHNDMERQRRVGLKNLFDMLKKQIPSIKDKERAPKVNILREAAKLCEALTREDEQIAEQRTLLKEQLRKRKELIESLRNMKQE